jgi:hypothetical protein
MFPDKFDPMYARHFAMLDWPHPWLKSGKELAKLAYGPLVERLILDTTQSMGLNVVIEHSARPEILTERHGY